MRNHVVHRLALAAALSLSLVTGCAVRLRPYRDWDRPGISFPSGNSVAAGSLRAYIVQTNRRLDPSLVERIAVAVVREADAVGLDPKVVAGLIAHESSFNPRAVSSSGALGLGQLLPGTARWLGVQDPYNPEQNIAGICKYLRTLHGSDSASPDWIRILASYRLGQGTIQRAMAATGTIPAVGQDYARDILGRAQRIASLG